MGLGRFDTNNSGTIEHDEVLEAIERMNSGDPDVSRADVNALIERRNEQAAREDTDPGTTSGSSTATAPSIDKQTLLLVGAALAVSYLLLN